MEQVEQNTKMLTTIVKGQAVYAAALVAIPLYFHALGKLYKKFGKFLITNSIAMLKVMAMRPIYDRASSAMLTCVDNTNELLKHMENPLVYQGASWSVDGILKINQSFLSLGRNENIIMAVKFIAFGVFVPPVFKTMKLLVDGSNEIIASLHAVPVYIVAMLRLKAQMKFIKLILLSIVKLSKDDKISRIKLEDIANVYKQYTKMILLFVPFMVVLKIVTDKIMPMLLKYRPGKYKKAIKRFNMFVSLIEEIILFVQYNEYLKQFKIIDGIKAAAKLAILSVSIYFMTGMLTVVGMAGPLVLLGGLVVSAVCGIFAKLFEMLQKIEFKRRPIKIFTMVLSALLSAWVAAKVTDELHHIGNPVVAGFAILGSFVVFYISCVFIKLFDIISKRKMDKKQQGLLKTLVDTIVVFIGAWAGAKLAETIAPIGPQAHWVMAGAIVVSIMSLLFVKLFMRISMKLKGKKLEAVKTLMNVMSSFITAWAGAKLAETMAPVGKRAKWVLAGAVVVAGVVLIFTSTFALISKMLDNKKDKMKLLRLSISLYAMSLAIVFMTINLAFAAVFAPLALATMTIVLAIAGMVALVGLMHRPVKRGAMAMMLMGFAMQTLASPILIFGITAALIALACGSVEMVITTVLATIAILFAFAGLAALCGVLMNKGVLLPGLFGLVALGVAMTLMTLPLLIMAASLAIISKLNIQEDALANIFRCFITGIKVFFEDDNLLFINPFMLGYIMASMFQMAVIISFVGCMADTLQHIAQLTIPTEFDEKGRGKKFVKMSKQDFIDAADNATTIIGFATSLFTSDTLKVGNENYPNPVKDMLYIPIMPIVKRSFRRLRTIVGYIGDMADTLQHIASLNMPVSWDNNGKPNKFIPMKREEFMDAANNAGAIMGFFTAMFRGGTKIKVNGEDILIPQIKIPFIPLIIKISFRRIRTMVGYIGDMAETVQRIAALSIPDEWNKEGKPIHFRQLNTTDFTNVGTNIDKIITCLVGNAKKIIEDPQILDALSSWDMEDAVNNIKSLMEPVSMCTDMIIKLATLQVPVVDGGQIKMDSKGNIVYRIFNESDFNKAGTWVQRIATQTIGIAASAVKLLDGGMGSIPGIPNIFGGNPMEDAIENLKNLMSPIAMMVDTVCKLAVLQVPASNPDGTIKTDAKGNIVYRLISDDDFRGANIAVMRILTGDPDWTGGNVTGGLIGIGKLAGVMLTDALEDNNTRDAFTNLGILMDPLSKMTDLVIKMASGQIPDGFDSNGKATGYHTLNDEDFKRATGFVMTLLIGTSMDTSNPLDAVKKLGTSSQMGGLIGIGRLAGKMLEDALEDNNVRDAFTNLGILMDPISSMVDIVIKLASGKVPTGFDKKGNATGYNVFDNTTIDTAVQNIKLVLDGVLGIFWNGEGKRTTYTDRMVYMSMYGDQFNESTAVLSSMFTDFGNMAEIITSKSLNKPKLFDGVSGNVTGIIGVMNEFTAVDIYALNRFQALSGSIIDIGNTNTVGIEKVSKNLKEFVKQIGDTDVNKLRNTADALHAIADISKSIRGDFNGLAKTINENLITVLEKLDESLANVGDKISNMGNITVETQTVPDNSGSVNDMLKNPAKDKGKDETKKPITKADLDGITEDIDRIRTAIENLAGCVVTTSHGKTIQTLDWHY